MIMKQRIGEILERRVSGFWNEGFLSFGWFVKMVN